MSDQPGNPTEPVMGTVAEADTSQVDDVISSVADEHTDTPENPSVAEQEVEGDTEAAEAQQDMAPEEPQADEQGEQ